MKFDSILREIKYYEPEAEGFCGPVALAATTGLDPVGMLDYCKEWRVSPRNYGMTTNAILAVARQLTGETPVNVTHKYPSARTMVTAERVLPRNKKFLVFVRGHVAAIVGGSVIDWTEGRRHRIKYIYEVQGV